MNNLIKTVPLIVGATFALPAQAGVSIPENEAQAQPIPINIVTGKASAIHFQNNQRISYILLSDRSRVVYSLNAETETGEARSIFLRQIKPLEFPYETTNAKPNLQVVAIDDEGNQKQYEFIIDNSPKNETNISIVPPIEIAPPAPLNVIHTSLGLANPEDIRLGLKYQLQKGKLNPNDELTFVVAEAIATTINTDQDLLSLAEEYQIPLSALAEMGRLGLIEKARLRKEAAIRAEKAAARRAEEVSLQQEVQALKIQEADFQQEVAANKKTEQTISKKVISINPTRKVRINQSNTPFKVETTLGEANKDDIAFGLSTMKKKNSISEQESTEIAKILTKIDTGSQISVAEKEQLKEVGRLGLAFQTRLRMTGKVS